MKPGVIAFFLFLLSSVSIAQQIKVTLSEESETSSVWGNGVKAGNKFIHYYEVGSRDHLSYGFGWNKVRLGLEVAQYDSTMKELKRVRLSDGKRVYGPFITAITKINEKVYIIYHEVQEKNTIGNLMAVRIDPETLEADTPKVIANIAATDYKLKFSESLQSDLKFYLTSSPDQKKTVVLLTGGDKQFFISALDANMNILWSRKEEFPEAGSFEYKSACIDNSGNAYIAYKIYNSEAEAANTKSRIAVCRASGKLIDLILKMDVATTKTILLLPSNVNNNIHIAGCYLENKDARSLKGVFYTTLNTTGFKLGNIKKTPFPDSLVHQFEGDGWGSTKTKDYGLSIGMAPQIFEKADGTVSITAEFRRREMSTKAMFNISGSILHVGFAKEAVYFSRIPKYRVSAGSTMGDSYHPFAYQDKMIIFYDDKDDNLKKALSESPDNSNNYKNSVLVAAIIDANGKTSRQLVIDLQKENYLGLTEYMLNLSPNKLLLPLQKVKGLGGAANNMRWASIELF